MTMDQGLMEGKNDNYTLSEIVTKLTISSSMKVSSIPPVFTDTSTNDTTPITNSSRPIHTIFFERNMNSPNCRTQQMLREVPTEEPNQKIENDCCVQSLYFTQKIRKNLRKEICSNIRIITSICICCSLFSIAHFIIINSSSTQKSSTKMINSWETLLHKQVWKMLWENEGDPPDRRQWPHSNQSMTDYDDSLNTTFHNSSSSSSVNRRNLSNFCTESSSCHKLKRTLASFSSYYGFTTKEVPTRSASPDNSNLPKLVVAGKLKIKDQPANIAEIFLNSNKWSMTDKIQLSLYFSYSGGEVYSLLANHSFATRQENSKISNAISSQSMTTNTNAPRLDKYDQYQSELVVVGAFDTTYSNSQVAYCSVGSWDGATLSKVGEGLCNSALSRGMKITTAAFSSPYNVYVAGSFETQVWNGYRHRFVKIFNIAHYNAITQVWLPVSTNQITCSWCTVAILALAWDSTRRQLHITGKFNSINGVNIPAGLAIYDLKTGRIEAHPGGGLSLLDITRDGVGTALQLDEVNGILYVMGSFERLTATNEICFGLAAYNMITNQWTCLADDVNTVVPSGGNNMLLTPYGLMVAGRTTPSSSWTDRKKPYTIALLINDFKSHESFKSKTKKKNSDHTINAASSNSTNHHWIWLPGFTGRSEPLHSLSNGVREYENTVFIGGDNYVAKYYWEQKSYNEVISNEASAAKGQPTHFKPGASVPVVVDLGKGVIKGQIMAIAQLTPPEKTHPAPDVRPVMIAFDFITLGAVLGILLMFFFNRKLNQTILSFISGRDSHTNGISLDTLTYSAVENTNVAEVYQRAMQTRFVQHPNLLTLINPQEIILHRIIGEGTFGRVWSAKWRSSSVAVKEFVFAQAAVAGKSAQQKEIVEEIIGEAGMMSILRHPNVLQLFGCSLTSQAIWIISELMSLGSLRQVLDETTKDLSTELRVRIALQVAEGMMYLHGQEPPIIHRDLKSHNILIHETIEGRDSTRRLFDVGKWWKNESPDENDEMSLASSNGGLNEGENSSRGRHKSTGNTEPTIIAKIGDWGSARATLAGSRTMTHGVGTACWLAPEVITHARSSKHSDVYGYGIILWELATREEVYSEFESTQIIAKVANDNLRPPVPKDCPWNDLMVKCWSNEPTDRPEFTEIVAYLNKLLADMGVTDDDEKDESSPLNSEILKNYSSVEE